MRRWIWLLIACGACRQVFGIHEPPPERTGDADELPPPDVGRLDAAPIDDAGHMPGLHMHVLAGTLLWDSSSSDWTRTEDQSAAIDDVWLGTGPDAAQLTFDGANPNGAFTVWFDGEIYGDQGQYQLQFTATDYAFFTVDALGTFVNVATSSDGMTDLVSNPVPLSGWYPVRIGWVSRNGTPNLTIRYKSVDDQAFKPYSSMNLRH